MLSSKFGGDHLVDYLLHCTTNAQRIIGFEVMLRDVLLLHLNGLGDLMTPISCCSVVCVGKQVRVHVSWLSVHGYIQTNRHKARHIPTSPRVSL